jgi:hypothetical protein
MKKLFYLLACVTLSASAQEDIIRPGDVPDVALGLGGGGFLSVTDMSGLTSGLLSVLMQQDPNLVDSNNALAESGLFSRVKSINSISGGSWFASMLAYSNTFRTTLEEVAKAQAKTSDSNKVADIYNQRDKIYRLSQSGLQKTPLGKLASLLNNALKVVKKSDGLPQSALQAVGLIATLIDRGVIGEQPLPIQWYDVLGYILEDDMQGLTFASPVQDWAIGKKWRVIVSVVAPNGTEEYDTIFNGNDQNYLRYSIFPSPPVEFLPARFSAVLGDPNAPADEFDSSGLLSKYQVKYSGKDFPFTLLLKEQPWAKSSFGISASLNEQDNFSDMPIQGPVSASSAFVGATTLNATAANFFDELHVDPSVYYAPKLTGKDAFDEPQDIMRNVWKWKDPSKWKAKSLAKIGAHEITDGGAVDMHGIATSVATGATELFIVDVVSDLSDWKKHFTGWVENDSSGPGQTSGPEVLAIFKDDQAAASKQELNLKRLDVPADTEILEYITFGTVIATTKENQYYGIEAGRKVSMNLFHVQICEKLKPVDGKCKSDKRPIGIGIDQDFTDYGILVSEITKTLNMKSNKKYVNKMMDILNFQNPKTRDVPDL